jgi:hypothetical protein
MSWKKPRLDKRIEEFHKGVTDLHEMGGTADAKSLTGLMMVMAGLLKELVDDKTEMQREVLRLIGRLEMEIVPDSIDHTGDGNVTLRYGSGSNRREFQVRLPCFRVRGGFIEGVKYYEGDGVSFDGSFFIATCDSPLGRPDERSGHWVLAAKRGRDAR